MSACWSETTILFSKLYILSCLLQFVAAGLLCTRLQLFTDRPLSNFCLGGAAVPLVQFLYAFILFLLPFSLPKLVYILPLPLGALAVIALSLRKLPSFLKESQLDVKIKSFSLRQHKAQLGVACIFLAVLIVWCLMLPNLKIIGTQNYSVSNDNAEYMTKATYLANTQRILPFLSLRGEPDGHFLMDEHFPTWTVYLAYALFHSPGAAGYPYDMAGQFANVACVCYLFAAYCGVLFLLCKNDLKWGAIGALLFFLIPKLGYPLLWASARDGFRALAMLLFVGYLLTRTSSDSLTETPRRDILCVSLFSFFLCASHVVGFLCCGIMLFSWLLLHLLQKSEQTRRSALILTGCGIGGCFIGAYRSVVSILVYHSLFLPKSDPLPAWTDVFVNPSKPVIAYSALEKLRDTFHTEITPVFACEALLALAAFILTFVYFYRAKHTRLSPSRRRLLPDVQKLFFLCLSFWLIWLPLSGIFDKIYLFSSYFVYHHRYMLHWRVLGAIIAVFSLAVAERAYGGKPYVARFYQVLSYSMAALAFFLVVAPKDIGLEDADANLFSYSYSVGRAHRLDSYLQTDERLLVELPNVVDGRKIIVTRQSHLYPYNGNAYYILCRAMRPLIDATTTQEVQKAMRELSVGAIITDKLGWDDYFYPYSALGVYLDTSPYVIRKELPEPSDIRIYYVCDPAILSADTQ